MSPLKSSSQLKLMKNDLSLRPEIWGGIECTVNRIEDLFHDQLDRPEHCVPLDEVSRVKELGIKALRFPVIWERMQPEKGPISSNKWPDKALYQLRESGIQPIIGLLHHGYGPAWTGILDPDFPKYLADYAYTVAERYPWITAYTPINEPLTTARFSGLYGHWYPHAQNARTFIELFLAQCTGIVESMRSIREATPAAQLIQTEDLGRVTGTDSLQYQCDFENERRWLTWDTLTGKLRKSESMIKYLHHLGIPDESIDRFEENPFVLNTIGINYYVTSERFLDEHIDRYGEEKVGGNGIHNYADVTTAHRSPDNFAGIRHLIREAWERYKIPIAITECHLGCTREEQLRWLKEVWSEANTACDEGIDIMGVTSWSLFGSYDWDSLVTSANGNYEPGAFDVRSPSPRRTAIGDMIKSFASGKQFHHPVLSVPGWWHRPQNRDSDTDNNDMQLRPLWITDSSSVLGGYFANICRERGIPCLLTDSQIFDLTDFPSVYKAIEQHDPWAIVNTADYIRDARIKNNRDMVWREDINTTKILASACARYNIPYVMFSSDQIFNGRKGSAYLESDAPSPEGLYGKYKATVESIILADTPHPLIVRMNTFFGGSDCVLTQALRGLQIGELSETLASTLVTPTYISDLVDATLDLLIDNETGIWHMTNGSTLRWIDIISQAADMLSINAELLGCEFTGAGQLEESVTFNNALLSERGWLLPSLNTALRRYCHTWVGELALA